MSNVISTVAMVPHIWAQQSQEEGRNSSNTIFFKGDTIYSYGYHYVMAKFVAPNLVLMNSNNFSATTASHKSHTRQALIGVARVIEVPTPDISNDPEYRKGAALIDHRRNIKHLVDEAISELKRAQRGRTTPTVSYAIRHHNSRVSDIEYYTEHFRIKSDKEVKKELRRLNKAIRECELSPEEMQEKAAATEAAAKARKAEHDKLKVPRWKAGELRSLPYDVVGTYLRKSVDQYNGVEVIETSRGARVPLREAKVLYKRWMAGKPIHGAQVGHFTVTSATQDEVRIGCHTLDGNELREFFAKENADV